MFYLGQNDPSFIYANQLPGQSENIRGKYRSLALKGISMNWVAFFHRWMGVIWLHFCDVVFKRHCNDFVPFPSVTNLGGSRICLRLSWIELLLSQPRLWRPAAARVFNLRIITFNSRPAYVCHAADQELKVIYADDAIKSPRLTKDEVKKLLERKEFRTPDGRIRLRSMDSASEFDQYRPFYRVALADSSETNLYIAPTTGDCFKRQQTRNGFGITSDLYPIGSTQLYCAKIGFYGTLLSGGYPYWSVFAVTGVYLGAYHWVKIRNQFSKALSPFRGWMRWHHILGLFAGLILVSWISSGWLSMDHGRLFSTQSPAAQQASAVRGGTLGKSVQK